MSKFLATCASALALASTFALQADEPKKDTRVLSAVVSQEEPTTPKVLSSDEPTTSKLQLALVSDETQNKDKEDKKDEPKAALLA